MVPVAAAPYRLKHSPYSSHSLLLDSLPPNGAGRRVLDVGCAGGYLGAILASRGYRVTGIDSPGAARAGFPESVEAGGSRSRSGSCRLSRAGSISSFARTFWSICASPRCCCAICAACSRAAAALAASLPNSGHAYFRWNVLRGRFPAEDRGLFDRTHLHFYTWRGWMDLFGAAGFRIETLRCSGVPIGLALPKWEGSAAVRAMERISFESARLWKTMFAYQFIVTAAPEREA